MATRNLTAIYLHERAIKIGKRVQDTPRGPLGVLLGGPEGTPGVSALHSASLAPPPAAQLSSAVAQVRR